MCLGKINDLLYSKNSGLSSTGENPPITLYEDNMACITQLKEGFIKRDRTKHISSKFFFIHDLQKNGKIDV